MIFKKREISVSTGNDSSQNKSLYQSFIRSEDFPENSTLSEKWNPRKMEVNQGLQKRGMEYLFLAGSPEQTLGDFFLSWLENDYIRMAEILKPYPTRKLLSDYVKEIIVQFENTDLLSFQFIKVLDQNPSLSKIRVLLKFVVQGNKSEFEFDLNLKYIGQDGIPKVFGFEEGIWIFDRTELSEITFH